MRQLTDITSPKTGEISRHAASVSRRSVYTPESLITPWRIARCTIAAEVEVHFGLHLQLGGCLGDGDRGQPEHQAFEGGGDGARIGDVIAEVEAVVDAGDDQAGLVRHANPRQNPA